MNRREKLLAGGLLAATALFAGPRLVDRALAPVREKERRARAAAERVEDLDRKLARGFASQRALRSLDGASLPPDASVATALYQNWLIEQAERSGLRNAVIQPGRGQPLGAAGARISFTLQARASLAAACDFLLAFEETPLLHRIVRIGVEGDRHEAESGLTFQLQIEALSLTGATDRDALLPSSDDAAAPRGGSSRSLPPEVAALLARQPFARAGAKESSSDPSDNRFDATKAATTNPPAPAAHHHHPPHDPAESVYLVASLTAGGDREAWLYDRGAKKSTVLREGDRVRVGSFSAAVRTIGADQVVLERDGRRVTLPLGRNLRQAIGATGGP